MMKRRYYIALAAAAALIGLQIIGCAPAAGKEADRERSAMQAIADASITSRVKTTYLFNPHLNSFRIDVDTRDGVVSLDGVVKSGIQKDLAGEIAKNARGVKAVRNDLKVTEGEVPQPEEVDRTFTQAVVDATITASVKTALAFEKGVKASDINVSTRWGTVTLEGEVGSTSEVELARKTTEDVAGVKDVVNKLEVSRRTSNNNRAPDPLARGMAALVYRRHAPELP